MDLRHAKYEVVTNSIPERFCLNTADITRLADEKIQRYGFEQELHVSERVYVNPKSRRLIVVEIFPTFLKTIIVSIIFLLLDCRQVCWLETAGVDINGRYVEDSFYERTRTSIRTYPATDTFSRNDYNGSGERVRSTIKDGRRHDEAHKSK
jgi:hypothetical protein